MESLIIIILLLILFAIWVVLTQRKLVILDENVNNAMSQIGVQLSSRLDVTMMLLQLADGYAGGESLSLLETTKARRNIITAKSTPNEVQGQEDVISEMLGCIAVVAEQHPELKEEKEYARCLNAADCYEKMIRTSCLIYNDSVTKHNRAIRMIPTRLVAGMLGFHLREYLEAVEEKQL